MRSLLVVGLFLLAGCSEPALPEPTWHGRDTNEAGWRQVPIFSCLMLEFDYPETSPPGPRLLYWDWFVEEQVELEFQLHTHQGQGVRIIDFAVDKQDRGEYEAPADGTYSFIWTHRGATNVTMWLNAPETHLRTGYQLPPEECHGT